MKLEGKTALVTGGGTGIGAAIAERFVVEGAKVCITGRRKEKLERQATVFSGGSVVTCAGDVSSHEDVRRMIAATAAFGGGIDILVNNAACDAMGPIAELDPDDWRRILEINLTGPFLLMKEVLPYMIRNGGGSIINIASIGGLRCMPGAPAYGTSKAGLIFLTQQAALDYGRFGVRCNALCPGATRTEMLEEAVSGIAKEMGADIDGLLERFSSVVPLRRVSAPREIAAVCTFLASEDSSFMTGAVVVADGGEIIVDVSGASIN
jgi:meso-butanediol dehydrogenase/(S,S)-butanediol dehydrogenase/diacetyl reductase